MISYQLQNLSFDHQLLKEELYPISAKALHIPEKLIINVEILRESIDARKKPRLKWIYTLAISMESPLSPKKLKTSKAVVYEEKKYILPPVTTKITKRPLVIGFGPAGMFAAYVMALQGLRPIVLERGEEVENRHKKIELFNKKGILDTESNIQFGEGGAGTYSDGKLNTGVKDRYLRKSFILNTFVEHGADPSILYASKPHVGTDYLMRIVKNIRQRILDLGGHILFSTKCTDMETSDGQLKSITCISQKEILEKDLGSQLLEGSYKASDGYVSKIGVQHLVLAIGHSARDTFRMLYKESIPMQTKPFAIGIRMEHPQVLINASQYGIENINDKNLPAADYKLTYHTSTGRGVYSFCMCPGGDIVNGASQSSGIVCNGMSYFKRNHPNANSALIVTVTPEDFEGNHPLKGMFFQEKWEKQAFLEAGESYALPCQSYGDFYLSMTGEKKVFKPRKAIYDLKAFNYTCTSAIQESNLINCLPPYVTQALLEGIEQFGRKIEAYDHPNAHMIGIETRTSSPIRIIRDSENFQSEIQGLFPCGEGAGYAGGIMSAAIDGMKCAETILNGHR